MRGKQGIWRNTISQVVMRFAADGIFFVFYVLLSRKYGTEGIGIYSFSLAFATMLFVAADYGLSVHFTREASRNKTELPKLLGNYLILKVAFTLLAIAVMALCVPLFHLDQRGVIALILIGISQMTYRFAEIFKSVFAVHERLSEMAFLEVVFKASICVFGVLLLFFGFPFDVVLLAFPVGGVVYFLSFYWMMRKRFGRPEFVFEAGEIKKAIRESLPFFLTVILGPLYFRLNPLLLQHFHGYSACGIYGAPYKLIEALTTIAMFYRISVFPPLSRLHQESKEGYLRLCNSSFRFAFMIALPLSVLMFTTSDQVIPLLFGPRFSDSILVMKLMSVYLLFAFSRPVLMAILGSIDKQWRWVMAQLAGLVIGIVLGLWFIPKFSFKGAALSLLISEMIVFVLAFAFAVVKVGSFNWFKLLFKPVVAAALMGFLVMFFLKGQSALITIPEALLFCLIVLFCIGGINLKDFRLIKDALMPM